MSTYKNTYEYYDSNEYLYSDSWNDQLIQVNDNPVTYDAIGNMTSYNGYNYVWTNGNELKGITEDDNKYEYEYNIDGIRTKKIVNGKITNYYLEGSNIIYEDRDGELLEYLYDESGISGFILNNNTYYFVKNIQGDIIEVLDDEFNVVATYTYDAWGVTKVNNKTEANIGDINPYRYRGYYYDIETGLYYLNSRYYNADLGRFISADSILGANEDIQSYNLYIYCSNNPIIYRDPSGNLLDALPNFVNWLNDIKEMIIPAVVVGGTNAGLFVVGVIAIGVIAKAGYDEIVEKNDKPQKGKEKDVRFPSNPYDFNPRGLVREIRVPTGAGKNGGIIHWYIPNTKIMVFEWDEDRRYGSHYHILVNNHHDGISIHFYPGMKVPEPFASRYF